MLDANNCVDTMKMDIDTCETKKLKENKNNNDKNEENKDENTNNNTERGDIDMVNNEESDSDAVNKDAEKEEKVLDLPIEERLTRAVSCKEHGNNLIKQAKNVEAKDSYTKGIEFLKDVEEEKVEGIKAKDLKNTLNLNLSLCCIRLEEWLNAIHAATNVIKFFQESINYINNKNIDLNDSKNNELINVNDKSHPQTQIYIKALYRRGFARSQFGLWEEAKVDLQEILKVDENNVDAKREMFNVLNKLKIHAEKNKKAFGGLFSKSSVSLYSDREEELKKRKEAEEAERKKQREQWHIEMNQRKEKNEDEISFEEWLEEKNKKEEEEKKRKEEEKRKEEKKKQNFSKSKSETTTDELDEEDEKIINETKKMGYCYFRRELSEKEKEQNLLNKPQKLSDSQFLNAKNLNNENKASKEGGVSKWNSKGTTYEEKDCTQWAKENITRHLLPSSVATNVDELLKSPDKFLQLFNQLSPNMTENDPVNMNALASIASKLHRITITGKSVKDVSGDAHIAVIRGTKRYIFDFSIVITFECSVDSSIPFPTPFNDNSLEIKQSNENKKISTYKGELHMTEIASTTVNPDSWINDMTVKYEKEPKVEHKQGVEELLIEFKKLLIERIKLFIKDFSESF